MYVAGGDTLIGAALLERLQATGHVYLVGTPPNEPDLTDAGQVDDFFAEAQPEYVFLAAGKSGGIHANRTHPAELMRHNLLVTTHVVHAAHEHGVTKLLYLASSCSYPRDATQPLQVEALMTGPLEPTSEAYALAKLAGLRLCRAYREQYGDGFISGIPANAFGPHDDFSPESGHVIPSLIRRLHEAKGHGDREVAVWGTGRPGREFIYARDLADACLHVMAHYDAAEPINLGGGADLSIAEVAQMIAEVVGYRGRLWFDTGKPDGAALKALDSGPLRALGFRPRTSFRTALEETYDWFQRHLATDDTCAAPAVLSGPVTHSAA
jgi:GDP-L-fucose synthase